jgi:predicted aminopeptidase
VRPDGSVKPHAAVIQRFAASHPRVAASRWKGAPEIDPEAYYQAPLANAKLAYRRYLDSVSRES